MSTGGAKMRSFACIGCVVILLLAGCATRPISELPPLAELQGRTLPKPVLQKSERGCGPAAVLMVAAFWGNPHPDQRNQRTWEEQYPNGMTPRDLINLTAEIGLQSFLVRGDTRESEELIWNELRMGRPVILCASVPLAWWVMLENRVLRYASQNPVSELGRHFQHYFVGVALDKSGDALVFDPRYGYLMMSQLRLRHYWANAGYVAVVTLDSNREQGGNRVGQSRSSIGLPLRPYPFLSDCSRAAGSAVHLAAR